MIYMNLVRISQEICYVSATETNRLMLFTVRTIRNTQIQYEGTMLSNSVLIRVVHIVTVGL
jgi:hypothetical protein